MVDSKGQAQSEEQETEQVRTVWRSSSGSRRECSTLETVAVAAAVAAVPVLQQAAMAGKSTSALGRNLLEKLQE